MASPQKKLSIAFYWHMHQPVYQLSPEGDYVMPWVRLHSVKDYLDMANIVKKFKNIKLNFNISPVLLNGFENYGEKGLHDLHSRFTVSDIEDFSTDDKNYILNNFFDSNYQSMILKSPEYNRLYQKYQESGGEDVDIFTNQEYSDLMALFNLAWMDPGYKNEYPELKKLYKKGKNYTKEDRIKIIEIQRQIIRRIVPEYRELIEKGKIEITTSPFYHPILPILLDIKDTVSGESDDLPSNLKTELDAKIQTQFALDRIEQTFGRRPRGIWPSEHCVSEKELNMFKELGVEWTISDEGILSESINFEFVRDFKGYLEDPYHLLKSYRFKTKYSNIDIIFRDAVIPNLISFEYPNHDSVAAANDLYDRIKVTQSKILSSPDENHLLTIAMDGENCWENYLDDGNEFLNTLYKLIDDDPTLETVLISDYLDREKNPKPLNKICAGSWINKTFKLWIDEPIKNLAWTYLKQVRDDFCRYVRKNPLNPNIKLARRELFVCEGSDWFWWYGEPNDSGRDNIFDYLFREHLKNIYLYLGIQAPEYLDIPLLSAITKPSRFPKGEFTPELTGSPEDSAEWLNAGCIDIPDGPVLKETKFFDRIYYGCDKENLYLRFYLNEYTSNTPIAKKMHPQIYIYAKNFDKKQTLSPVRVIHRRETILPVAKEKFHNEIKISIDNNRLDAVRFAQATNNNLWIARSSKKILTACGRVLDMSIPFDILNIAPGDTLEFMFANANFDALDSYIPNNSFLTLKRSLPK